MSSYILGRPPENQNKLMKTGYEYNDYTSPQFYYQEYHYQNENQEWNTYNHQTLQPAVDQYQNLHPYNYMQPQPTEIFGLRQPFSVIHQRPNLIKPRKRRWRNLKERRRMKRSKYYKENRACKGISTQHPRFYT